MMDSRLARNLIAVLITILILAFMVLLSGCNMYSVQRCEGEVCSTADIKSMRKFANISFKYNGEARTFELEAGDVSTDNSAVATLANVILMQQTQGDKP